MSQAITDRVRNIIKDHARLSKDIGLVENGDDLYQAGMTSHASVNVMLALESEFDIEFPDHMLKRSVFESVNAISGCRTRRACGRSIRGLATRRP